MKYTKEQLADLLHVPKKSISAWASPSKRTIILDDDEMIDDDIDRNKKFISKKLGHLGLTPEEKKIVVKTVKKKNKPSTPTEKKDKPKKPDKDSPKELSPEAQYINESDKRKNDLIIQKLEEEVRGKRADADRKEGDFIDAKKAKEAAQRWSIEKDKYLLQQLEKDIKYICDREGIPADRAARYRKKLPVTINQSSERATERLKKTFDEKPK